MQGTGTLRILTAGMLYRRQSGLTATESMVLVLIAQDEGCGLIQLVKEADQTPDTMTKVCRALLARGMIEVRKHPTDHRRKQLYLTADGREFIRGIIRAVTRATRHG